MSGICAILGPNAEQLVKKVCSSLRHRGPDDEGFFMDKDVALGHTALKITDIPIPHQPLSNEDETVWITFDGEIYNAEELKEQLDKNHTFDTNSSAEVVVHAYEDYGFNCLRKFNGMFAFCLWDCKNKQLFSARDRVGMKPLYYHSFQGRFILASEIKGILAIPSIPRKPNKRFVYEYLITGYPIERAGNTFFAGIKELMPARYMVISNGGITIRRYWQPTRQLKSNISDKGDHWYASEFRRLLRDSISIRLPVNLPVGTFLSGGLDSTSMVFLVDEILKSRHSTATKPAKFQEVFSAIYKEPTEQGDERRYVKEAESALRTDINYVFPSVVGQWDKIKRFIFYIEEPVSVFNYYVFWCLFQAAKQKVKIVFSGQGNDAVLGGQTEHVLTYFKELWGKKKIGKLLKEMVKSLDWILPYMAYSILFKRTAESKAKMLLAPPFVRVCNQGTTQTEAASLQDALFLDITQHYADNLGVDDRASSFFSMDCRHPFLDHRIIEFAFSLPTTQRFRNGWTKYVMRNAMKGLIPEAIRRKRKKFGAPIPQQRWMRELRGNIRKLFGSSKFREREYFNQAAILDVYDRYCDGRLSRLERQFYADVLWRILNLELWLENFFDPENKIKPTEFYTESMEGRSR